MPVLPKYRTDFTNNAEKEIYQKAIDSDYFDTQRRYLFHSLRNHKAKGKIVGEVDFVYLDDQYMIFLESKGGAVKYDSTKDEWWILGGTKKGDPFKQVTNYLFYIRNKILPEYFPNQFFDQKLIFGYGVMFPEVERKLSFTKKSRISTSYKQETIEYDPEIIYSSSDHEKENGLVDYLEHLKDYWRKHDRYSTKNQVYGIGLNGLEVIRKFFRKDLIFEIPIIKVVSDEDHIIQQFTEEQFAVLDSYDLIKDRGILVMGGPGTGKTIMAKELLLRQTKSGKRCAYFCYNKNLAGEIRRSLNQYSDNFEIHAYHVHGFLTNFLKNHNLLPKQIDDSNYYWNEALPQQFKLWRNSLDINTYDFIVIDEAQDVFTESLIDAIFTNLKGGIDSGKWAIFIDAKYQRFYKRFDSDYFELFLNTYPCMPQHLPLNCRNHSNIVKVASLHSGLENMPCRRTKVPFKTTSEYYSENDEFLHLVESKIKGWIKNGVKPEQITILTASKAKLRLMKSKISIEIHEVNESNHKCIGSVCISTIHSYKGLENDFICVAGIDKYDQDNKEDMSLLFVGYSRTKMGLHLIMDRKIEEALIRTITKV